MNRLTSKEINNAYGRYRMCLRKKQWTQSEAKGLEKQWGERFYECPICHMWHCTKRDPDAPPKKLPKKRKSRRTSKNATRGRA